MSRSFSQGKGAKVGGNIPSKDHLTLTVKAVCPNGDGSHRTPIHLVTKTFGTQSTVKAHLRSIIKMLRSETFSPAMRTLTQPVLSITDLHYIWAEWELLLVTITDSTRIPGEDKRFRRIYRNPDTESLEEESINEGIVNTDDLNSGGSL